MYDQKLLDRFWRKVDKSNPDGCWPWLAAKTSKGYGIFYVNGKHKTAHVVAWEIANGRPMEPGKIGRHSCDTPWCVRPDHVLPGTYKENTEDMFDRGREAPGHVKARPGESNGHRVLNDLSVQIIRMAHRVGVPVVELARVYKVHKDTIRLVVNRKTWRHVEQWQTA